MNLRPRTRAAKCSVWRAAAGRDVRGSARRPENEPPAPLCGPGSERAPARGGGGRLRSVTKRRPRRHPPQRLKGPH